MKFTNTKTILTTALILFMTPVFANNSTEEKNISHTEQGVGLGAGSIAGGLIAGPVGIVTGALIGSLVGQNVADEHTKQTLSHSNTELINKLTKSSSKIQILEDTSSHHIASLKDARLTIEKLLTQNQELKNHALNFDVQFRTDSFYIESQYQDYLIDLVNALNEAQHIELEVAGFADRMGDEDYNMELSNKRAQQVKNFLIQQGIKEERITTLAYGETKPLHPEESLENNFFDRRVNVYLRPIEFGTKNISQEITVLEDDLSVATNEQ